PRACSARRRIPIPAPCSMPPPAGISRLARKARHCEERSDEAIQGRAHQPLDCVASLAMTTISAARNKWTAARSLGSPPPAPKARRGGVRGGGNRYQLSDISYQ